MKGEKLSPQVQLMDVEETETGLLCHVGSKCMEIPNSRRQVCEEYTRVMGYYRPVSEFNIGKRQEQLERKLYSPNAIS